MTTPPAADGYSRENAEKLGWAGFAPIPFQPERQELLERNVVGETVLDAGCGSGAFADHFARRGFDVTGVDKYDFCLAAAAELGYKGRFVQADLAGPLPFPDRSFDTTYCCDVLEHVDDYAVLKELARVTRRRIIFTVPQDGGWLMPYRLVLCPYQDPTHLRYYTDGMVQQLAASVAPAKVAVSGEQPVDVTAVLQAFLQPRSRVRGVGRVYKWASRYLIRRTPHPGLCINWAAVLDLAPAGGAE